MKYASFFLIILCFSLSFENQSIKKKLFDVLANLY